MHSRLCGLAALPCLSRVAQFVFILSRFDPGLSGDVTPGRSGGEAEEDEDMGFGLFD